MARSRNPAPPATDISMGDDEIIIVSKSQQKREAQAMQALGQQLCELRAEQVESLPMSDRLRSGIDEYHRIRSHEARRRHLQYIGKIIRQEDVDTLTRRVEGMIAGSAESTRRLHLAEHWRERLIDGADSELTLFLEAYPGADVQQVRTLVRNTRRSQQQGKNDGSSRKLFRLIKDLIDAEEIRD